MNIGAGQSYPSSSLSNFAGHRFQLDDVICNSFEGFIQSVKFASPEMQVHVCSLIGKSAKFKGKKKKWYLSQTLYWRGVEIKRDSKEYQLLLNRAYNAMYTQSESFRNALKASGKGVLKHSMGKSSQSHTVLTISEFCGRLMHLRDVGLLSEDIEKL